MDKKTFILTVIAIFISSAILYISANPTTISAKLLGIVGRESEPRQLYHIYLGGKSLGLIESKEELEKYIDEVQVEIKEKYNVNKVYIPNDLDIVQEITYNNKVSSINEIYNKIVDYREDESFTIDGYKITINGYEKMTEDHGTQKTEDVVIYVLDKNLFKDSVEKTIKSFISEEDYDNFFHDTQKEITETGTIIEDLYIQNNITITKTRIPANSYIYLTEEDLCKYLLFGTTDELTTYTVKEGDTISDIATNHKLSADEFLIANTTYKTSNDLLYPGEVVTLGVIEPRFDTIEETHVVSKKVKTREIVYEDDPTQYTGYESVKEEGSDGLSLVTEKIKLVNGEITSVVPDSEQVITAPVNKVIVRGTRKYVVSSGGGYNVEVPVGIGSWVWPTNAGYTLSSGYGWRGGKLHAGMDISGTGYGSPIKAANNGIVVISSYTGMNGHYIVIKHANGYFTEYAHLSHRNVQKGQVVYAGDVIGGMGNTGYAWGVHLHYGLWTVAPYTGNSMNPMNLYR